MPTQEIFVPTEPFDVLEHFKVGELPCRKLRIVDVGESFQHRFKGSTELSKGNTAVSFQWVSFDGGHFTPVSHATGSEKEPWMEMRTVWQMLIDFDSGCSQYLVTEEKKWTEINIFFSKNNPPGVIIKSAVYVMIDKAGNVSVYGAPANFPDGHMQLVCKGKIFLPSP